MTIKDKVKDRIHDIEDASEKMLVPEHEHTPSEVIKRDVEVIKEKIHEIEEASDELISHSHKK